MTRVKKRKNTISAILAIVMVCCLIVIATLAWLQYRTQEEVNTFTFGSGVKVELKEDKYDVDEKKNDFTPGMVIDKDPTVYIPEVGVSEYIAVTVRYYIEEVNDTSREISLTEVDYPAFRDNYAKIHSFRNVGESVNVNGNKYIPGEDENLYELAEDIRSGWVTDDYKVFYYGAVNGTEIDLTPVTSGASITLFDKVKINNPYNHTYSQSGNYSVLHKGNLETSRPIQEGQLKGFRIDICAYAVQGNISSSEGKAALDSLISEHS